MEKVAIAGVNLSLEMTKADGTILEIVAPDEDDDDVTDSKALVLWDTGLGAA